MIDRDDFFNGYLDAILFTEPVGPDDDTNLLGHGCERDDFSPAALSALREDCEAFIEAEAADLDAYCELRGEVRCAPDSFGRSSYSASECAGTDFWLSRNGHGAGFFDRGNEPVFRRLQDAARVYGEVYVDFDGDIIHAN